MVYATERWTNPKSNECPSNTKKTLKIKENGSTYCFTPYKEVKINSIWVKTLDTESDVNLVINLSFIVKKQMDERYFNGKSLESIY